MDSVNTNELADNKITSRYTIVLAAAKRARQIINGAHPLTYAPTDRAVSIAVKEMSEGKLQIHFQEDLLDGSYEKKIQEQYRYRAMSTLSKDDLREELKEDYEPDTYVLENDADGELFRTRYDDNELLEEKDSFETLYDDEFSDEE